MVSNDDHNLWMNWCLMYTCMRTCFTTVGYCKLPHKAHNSVVLVGLHCVLLNMVCVYKTDRKTKHVNT